MHLLLVSEVCVELEEAKTVLYPAHLSHLLYFCMYDFHGTISIMDYSASCFLPRGLFVRAKHAHHLWTRVPLSKQKLPPSRREPGHLRTTRRRRRGLHGRLPITQNRLGSAEIRPFLLFRQALLGGCGD